MPKVNITFTTKEVENILLAFVETLRIPGTAHKVDFKITRGGIDPREPSSDHVSGVTVTFETK